MSLHSAQTFQRAAGDQYREVGSWEVISALGIDSGRITGNPSIEDLNFTVADDTSGSSKPLNVGLDSVDL